MTYGGIILLGGVGTPGVGESPGTSRQYKKTPLQKAEEGESTSKMTKLRIWNWYGERTWTMNFPDFPSRFDGSFRRLRVDAQDSRWTTDYQKPVKE